MLLNLTPKLLVLAKLHCSGLSVVCKSLSCVLWQRDNLMLFILKLFLLVPIYSQLFIWYLLFSNYSGNNLPRPMHGLFNSFMYIHSQL